MVDYGEIFKSGLKGIARTHTIHESLEQNPKSNLDEIKSKARATETKIAQTTDRLMKEEFFLDDKTTKLVTQLQKESKEKFPQFKNLSFVIVGSSLHGGRIVRESLGTQNNIDLDLVMFHDYDQFLEDYDYEQLTDHLKLRVQDLKTDFGFSKDYKLCGSFNPEFQNYTNFKSIQDAEELLNKLLSGISPHSRRRLLYSFYPSFPSEVNLQNQGMILDGLKEMSKKNHILWEQTTKELVYEWETYHKIDLKHLLESHTIKKYKINPELTDSRMPDHARERLPGNLLAKYFDIITASEKTMSQHFKNLLETTKS